MARNDGVITIEDAKIVFVNFSGKEDNFNREGNRNFCVFLDDDTAAKLLADGWNVKGLKSREAGEPDQPLLEVAVAFKVRPPRIIMIGETTRRRTELDEDSCEILDQVDRVMVDLSISPYHWEVNGKTGIKAYLKAIYVIIEEDYLDLKYAAMDDLPTNSGKVVE
jgi:hypothetical protein